MPIATGNGSDALLALRRQGKWVVLRVPYPMGFFAKGIDGRIDDPKSRLEGQGPLVDLRHAHTVPPEGGKGTTSKVVHFQLRPDPLAK